MHKLDVSLLRPISHFRSLSEGDMRTVLDHARSQRFDAGRDVFSEGEAADRFYLLLDGHIRVVRTNEDGEEIIILHIHSGGMFGIAPALGRSTYPATARTAGEIYTLSWPTRLWHRFTTDYPGFAQTTYGTVGDRVAEMNTRIMELATKQVDERVACALLRIAIQSGKKTEAGIRIGFPLTRQNIADLTGSTLYTISRLLAAWDKQGVIRSARREIVVTNPEALMQIAGQSDLSLP